MGRFAGEVKMLNCINYALNMGFEPANTASREGIFTDAEYHNHQYNVDLFVLAVETCGFKIIGYRDLWWQPNPEPFTLILTDPSFSKFCTQLNSVLNLNEDYPEGDPRVISPPGSTFC